MLQELTAADVGVGGLNEENTQRESMSRSPNEVFPPPLNIKAYLAWEMDMHIWGIYGI